MALNANKLEGCRKTAVAVMIFVAGSRRPNAMQFGIGIGARIMIDDQLVIRRQPSTVSEYSPDEVLAILAHELGHWAHSHMIKTLTIVGV